jgi:hypothetical protein
MNSLFRAIVGPVSSEYVNEEAPAPYRQAGVPQTVVNGSLLNEPSEAYRPITENLTINPFTSS